MDFEKEMDRIIQQYQQEGYTVFRNPDLDTLGEALGNVSVDLLARRGIETVLVQVKLTRADVEADSSIAQNAAAVHSRPGWRYDLIVLEKGDPVQRITRGSREPSNEEIDQTLMEVEGLLETGHDRAAFVMAWAALEAAMRQVASDIELYMPKTTPVELLRSLYGNGFLSREEFTQLSTSYRVRTEIVHGLVSGTMSLDSIQVVIAETRRLLSGNLNTNTLAV